MRAPDNSRVTEMGFRKLDEIRVVCAQHTPQLGRLFQVINVVFAQETQAACGNDIQLGAFQLCFHCWADIFIEIEADFAQMEAALFFDAFRLIKINFDTPHPALGFKFAPYLFCSLRFGTHIGINFIFV